MKEYSTFDILGPIMIGPSSSHTAGAVRLGKISKQIAGQGFYEVEFILHGSFAMTYKGHGTDRALIAGILGMNPDDERIVHSFDIAKENNINIVFSASDLGYQHPNTVKILFKYEDKEDFYVIGSSIGGGNIIITNINGNELEMNGNKPTILLKYLDRKGVISEISSILAKDQLNIATMKVTRDKDIATMVCELDDNINSSIVDKISTIDKILYVKSINPIVR
ncbi:L-serine ammonia-lyase, iron-sulfur-dependent subunit beta [Wansuia hejianensis]|uniref:L-serine deaminase n=1 Tax=Wansuia hejianensis TaxID=2763667 RepID=A0A926IND7_9FIRM|nr:L-serine ammonia-lyase, iron-sulfur-dependent subunit beta [Wansuia hejianensis]MBC8591345.1 L-serine ammonia-lyase, iron-sulfur-dependent, subunit beta [Wansuia hejianensis]